MCINLHVVVATQLIMESQKDTSLLELLNTGMTSLNGKRVKNSKKPAIFDHILLKDHDSSFEEFTILLKESNHFKLHLKESFLIKRDKPELKGGLLARIT